VSAAKGRHVIVVGAGIGGLAAALDLAATGIRVTLLERHDMPGGKMREVPVGDRAIDSGPTVFTMRWVFDDLFATAGRRLDDELGLVPAEILARHAWPDGSRLDLFADVDRSMAAIEAFAGPGEAAAYRRFAAESAAVFETLDHSFMRVERPGPIRLGLSLGLRGLPRLVATRPFRSLWQELGRVFSDPRLRQLFGRYATYCGSSPFEAPATLMLIAHAERAGVWYVRGGMQRLAETLTRAARDAGATLRFGAGVRRLLGGQEGISGVELDDGETLTADAVLYNGDVAALGAGLLGSAARRAIPARDDDARSISAVTWSLTGAARGFPLAHHTVFFGTDYQDEFDSLFKQGRVTREPTVYVCAQDRGDGAAPPSDGERLFLLINAPPRPFGADELARCEADTWDHLARLGLRIEPGDAAAVRHGPDDFAARFPGTGGAIYGWPTHGWSGSFRRPGSRSRLPRLYLAGGTVHPGPGVPMAALSGRIAARALREDLGLR
jgi:1-hydroxycarotenoid 3,4-desaturase